MTDWYGPEHLPHGLVHGIVARWPGYEVPAATATDKKGRRTWYEVRGRDLVRLHMVPEAWRPAPGRPWVWPGTVPEPLPISVIPRVGAIGGVAFDAAAAAAEMEEWREAARANARDPEARDPTAQVGQWWRDVTRVAYQALGSVTREMAEARILRHLILERSLPLDLRRAKSNAAVLADMKRSLADVYGEAAGSDWVPPLVAQPEDHRDFETVMGWLAEVGTTRRELMVLRARMQSPPITWVQIGDALHIAAKRARTIYDGAIDDLLAAANRQPRRSVARIAEVRARNREARR